MSLSRAPAPLGCVEDKFARDLEILCKRPGQYARLARGGEEGTKFFGCDGFELSVGALGCGFVGAPAAEVGEVTEAIALHVLIGYLDDELGAEEFPA